MSASGNVFYGFGYSGSGVGPCHMGGQILASLVQGLDNPWTRSPLVNGPLGYFPPEPIRYLGSLMVRNRFGARSGLRTWAAAAASGCAVGEVCGGGGKADKG
jgi:hypothetical protein